MTAGFCRTVALVAGATLTCGLFGCATPSGNNPSGTRPRPERSSVERALNSMYNGKCPPSPPALAGGSDRSNPLIPPKSHPRLVICVYGPMSERKSGQKSLVRVDDRDSTSVVELTDQINDLSPVAKGTRHCPLDDGSFALLAFGSQSQGHTLLQARFTGCQFIRGSSQTRQLSPRALQTIHDLAR